MPAELPLVLSSIALAFGALLIFSPWALPGFRALGCLAVLIAAVLPIALLAGVDPARLAGRTLWEWSAVGGPSIRASYRIDPLAAIAASLVVAYSGAALANAARIPSRHPTLAAATLAVGLAGVATVVTADLIAAIVGLAVLGALTTVASLAIAPRGATARTAAYLSVGLQAWILCALLLSLHGSPSFAIGVIPAAAMSAGAIGAATVGALCFAGLYPAVPWSVEDSEAESDPGPVGSLLLMPASIAGSLLLLRLLSNTSLPTGEVPLPDVPGELRIVGVLVILAAVALRIATAREPAQPRRAIAVGTAAIVVLFALPSLHWAEAVLIALILTALYAGVVSIALPDRWSSIGSDLATVALWIGIATGSGLGLAAGLLALFARAASGLIGSFWLEPHRDYIAFIAGSSLFVAAAVAGGAGALSSRDPAVALLALAAAGLLVVLELAQVARRFRVTNVPMELDVTSATSAFLMVALGALVMVALLTVVSGQERSVEVVTAWHVAAIVLVSTLSVTAARNGRALLPWLEAVAARAAPAMRALDPVPVAVGWFRATGTSAVIGADLFARLERRAGVWVAALFIVALLAWVVR